MHTTGMQRHLHNRRRPPCQCTAAGESQWCSEQSGPKSTVSTICFTVCRWSLSCGLTPTRRSGRAPSVYSSYKSKYTESCTQLHAHGHPLVSQPRAEPVLPLPPCGAGSWRISMTMGICPCAMTEMSTTTMNCNCGKSTVCSQKDEDRPQDPRVLLSSRKDSSKKPRRLMPNMHPQNFALLFFSPPEGPHLRGPTLRGTMFLGSSPLQFGSPPFGPHPSGPHVFGFGPHLRGLPLRGSDPDHLPPEPARHPTFKTKTWCWPNLVK